MFRKKAPSTQNGITEGVIWKEILRFFFPILFGSVFQQLYNMVDAAVVGRFLGKQALSAVGGSTGSLISLILGFFVGVSVGANVIVAQRYGAEDKKATSEALHTAAALSLVGGVVMTAVGLLSARPALELMSTPEDVVPYAMTYLSIYFSGTVFNLIYNMGSGILRALGDSRRPLYFLIACCVANIVLDLLFVLVLGMGVAGAALATVASQAISAVLVILTLMKKTALVPLIPGKIRIHFHVLRPLIRIGLPSGLEAVLYSISNVIIQTRLNLMGTDVVSAVTAYSKGDTIFWLIMQAFGLACTTFVGQNLGAKKLDRVYRSIHVCVAQCTVCTVVLSAFFCVFGRQWLGLFTTDANVISIGYQMMLTIVPLNFTFVLVELLSGAMRGAGDSFTPMVIVCFGTCVLRAVWILGVVPLNPTYQMVCYSYPVSWTITSVMLLICYKRRKWLTKAVV